jgi:hypothetical protein
MLTPPNQKASRFCNKPKLHQQRPHQKIAPLLLTPSSLRTHHIYASYQPITRQIFSDPTGRFILPSSTGNKGMLLLYDHDNNYIHVKPLKNHQSSKMYAAYKRGHALFTQRRLKPQLQNLDNEASAMLQQFMTSENIDFQLLPFHVHHCNAAEELPSAPSRTTLLPASAAPARTSRCTYRTGSSPKH